jgi:hypothetical protein
MPFHIDRTRMTLNPRMRHVPNRERPDTHRPEGTGDRVDIGGHRPASSNLVVPTNSNSASPAPAFTPVGMEKTLGLLQEIRESAEKSVPETVKDKQVPQYRLAPEEQANLVAEGHRSLDKIQQIYQGMARVQNDASRETHKIYRDLGSSLNETWQSVADRRRASNDAQLATYFSVQNGTSGAPPRKS